MADEERKKDRVGGAREGGERKIEEGKLGGAEREK